MGLKRNVVIVNEFTTKTAKGGSRGGTPGDYVLRYMARDGATEDLTPVRKDTENFILRYMARADAVDEATSVSSLKEDMRDIQGQGGIAFGYGDFSLSHTKLKKAAKDIQKNFNNGKTVMKTVLSFDEDYLRTHGLIDSDFHLKNEGDYRGNLDQLKLRMAIMHGLDKMGKSYDDLQYIGVIQVDTKHVHCHLAMVDRGKGTIMPDGTQRGKITAKEKRDLRRGIETYLDDKQTVKMMSANVAHDKRNTICFIKKFTHKAMDNRGFSQFLIACLPKDKTLWRAGSNNKDMQKPNAIVRTYVNELLKQSDSGYSDALKKIDTYARHRVNSENLSEKEYRQFYKEGQKRIIEDSMNSVYSILKQIPDSEMTVRTPMLEVMAMPYEDMASEVDSDPMVEFGFKLRSYKSRLDFHKKERKKYHNAVRDYESRKEQGVADISSQPLYDYLKFEEEYNSMLLFKYQHFLRFMPPDDEYMSEFDKILKYDERINNNKKMLNDTAFVRMSYENAEDYGIRVYGETGGKHMIADKSVIEDRISRMENRLSKMKDDFKINLSDNGLMVGDKSNIIRNNQYEFDDVKALDLHHLFYDFPNDFNVSQMNIDRFINVADKRYDLFDKAKSYLINTGQSDLISSFPVSDIEIQKAVADKFKTNPVMHTKRETDSEKRKATRTVRIDYDFYVKQEEDIKTIVKQTIDSIQYD